MLNLLIATCLVPTITLESVGMRAHELVTAFAKQSGEKLVCSPSVANEPLVISLNTSDFETAKKHLAWAVSGAWRQNEDEIILERSSSAATQQERADDKAMQGRISKLIADELESLKGAPKFDEKMATSFLDRNWSNEASMAEQRKRVNALKLSSPTFRQGITWLKSIGAAKLASIPVGSRSVYSDSPTPLQSRLPSSAVEISSLLRQADIINERQLALGKEPSYQAFIDYLTMGGKGDGSSYRKTLFVVQRRGFAIFWFQLYCFDRNGQLITAGQGTIPNRLGSNTMAMPGKGTRLEIDDLTRKLARVQSDLGVALGSGSSPIKLSDGSQTGVSYSVFTSEREGVPYDWGVGIHLRQPYKNDPIGYFAGKLLLQMSKRAGQAFIGTVPDSSLVPLARALSRGQVRTDDDLIAFLTEGADQIPYCQVKRENGWLAIRPLFPSQSYANRFNRKAAEELINKMTINGVLTLADASEYAKVSPGALIFGATDIVLMSHAVPQVPRLTIEETLQGAFDALLGLGLPAKDISPGSRRFETLSRSLQNSIQHWILSESGLGETVAGRGMVNPGKPPLESEATEMGSHSNLSLDVKVTEVAFIRAQIKDGHSLDLSIGSLAYEENQPEIASEPNIARRKFSY